jgi:EAL domain-containing protein (putative c-di-GMP-specific phosphodiesterase class I)
MVLRAAIGQLSAWRAIGIPIAVAVNLSASDLLDEQLAEHIVALLAEHEVPVEALELEITESVLMTDPERAHKVLERLRGLGLRIAVDDYGTGYCSLAYLRDLPIDTLKIDRTFIDRMSDDGRSAAIVRSTIELAHALQLEVIAEGVEHARALETLNGCGCDFAQGYHFSRPLPADAFAEFVAKDMAFPPRPLSDHNPPRVSSPNSLLQAS